MKPGHASTPGERLIVEMSIARQVRRALAVKFPLLSYNPLVPNASGDRTEAQQIRDQVVVGSRLSSVRSTRLLGSAVATKPSTRVFYVLAPAFHPRRGRGPSRTRRCRLQGHC